MTPEPDSRAARIPPDRLPPAAIGVLTPPPPPGRGIRRGFPSFGWNRALLVALLVSAAAGVPLLLTGDPFWLRATGGSMAAFAFLGGVQIAEFALAPMLARRRERRWLRLIASRG